MHFKFATSLYSLTPVWGAMCSGNQLGLIGWRCIIAALEGCTNLSSLNGFSDYQKVLSGGIRKLDIDGKELALAFGPYLVRSASSLTALEMRCSEPFLFRIQYAVIFLIHLQVPQRQVDASSNPMDGSCKHFPLQSSCMRTFTR
jgi:hypothetical protein